MQRYRFIQQLEMRGNNAYVQFYRSLIRSNQKYFQFFLEEIH